MLGETAVYFQFPTEYIANGELDEIRINIIKKIASKMLLIDELSV